MTQTAGKGVFSRMRWLTAWSLLLIAAFAAVPQGAFAQAPGLSFRSRSFITPFPQSDRYNLYVIGDGLAEGLASGLQQAFEKDNALKIINAARPSNSLARPDRTNWAADIDDLIKAQPMHIAVVMMGTNDFRSIRTDSGSVRLGTDEWREAYAKEVDRLLKVFKDRNVAVYWVGLPVMADSKLSDDMNTINSIVRERAYVGNVKFIDSWAGFIDQNGGFSAFGPDLTGQTQRLREADGMSFTARGNRKLANYVEIMVRRDLNEARAERNVPLLGDEDEQNQLIAKPESDPAKAAPDAGKPAADSAGGAKPWTPDNGSGGNPGQNIGAKVPSAAPLQGLNAPKAVGGQAVPPSFRAGDAPAGETILGDIDDGVTSLATVSPMADLNASIDSGERRLPVTERLYYKALVKGEALRPKPNRADDFKWPRG